MDVACGTGLHARALAERGAIVRDRAGAQPGPPESVRRAALGASAERLLGGGAGYLPRRDYGAVRKAGGRLEHGCLQSQR